MAQERCLICKQQRPEGAPPLNAAVKPHVLKSGKVVEPHQYGVCDDCHAQQYREVYGYTPAEAPAMAPPDDPFASEYED